MRIRRAGPAFIVLAAIAWGCGGGGGGADVGATDSIDVAQPSDEGAGDPDSVEPDVADEDLPAPVDARIDVPDVPVTAEAPILLLEKRLADTAWGEDPQFPLDGSNGSPLVRVSACGTVGVLFRDVLAGLDGTFDSSVVVQIFAATGESAPPRGYLATAAGTVAPLPISGTVVFSDEADGCKPLVWRASDDRPGYDLWTRQDDGTWEAIAPNLGLEKALGKSPAALRHLAADVDRLGQLHLLFVVTFSGGDSATVHAWVKDGAWTVTTFQPPVTDKGCFGYAFAPMGALHAVCRQGADIVHGVLEGAQWTYAVAVAAPDADTVLMPFSIALGGYDVPVIAYTRLQRIEDGPGMTPTYGYADLGLAIRSTEGIWSSQVIVPESDGYLGGDGKRFTGWAPMAVVPSGTGGIHIAFSDIAAYRDANQAQGLEIGQARYAFRTGSDWKLATVLPQRFLADDHRSGLGWSPLIGVSPNGRQAAFLVLEQERAKVLPLEGKVPGTIRLKLVRTSR
jgi:hypothetical protein